MASSYAWQHAPPDFEVDSPDISEDTKARTWHRTFWASEYTFAIVATMHTSYTDMVLSCHLDIPKSTTVTIEHARLATRALRWHHPGIAALIAFPPFTNAAEFKPREGRLVYRTATGEEEVSRYLDEVVLDRSSLLAEANGDLDRALEARQAEIADMYHPRSKWMFEVNFIGDAASNQYGVMLRTGHTILDGIGTFEVLDLWLHELASVLKQDKPEEFQWGEEAVRLARAVPDRQPPSEKPENNPILKAMAEVMNMPPVQFGLPLLHEDAPPRTSGTFMKMVPPPLAAKLRRAARAHGVGVFSVFAAASYLVLLSMSPPTEFDGELYGRMLPSASDLRAKYLKGGPAAKKDRSTWEIASALGFGVFTCRHLERFLQSEDLKRDVWTVAKELQEQVTEQGAYMPSAAHWGPDGIRMLINASLNPIQPPEPKYRHVSIQSMGVIDDSLSATYPAHTTNPVFSISKPLFFGMGPNKPKETGALVRPYTWQGQLYISCSFSNAHMGTVEEQKERDQEGVPTLYGYVERFADLLQKLAEDVPAPQPAQPALLEVDNVKSTEKRTSSIHLPPLPDITPSTKEPQTIWSRFWSILFSKGGARGVWRETL